MGTSFDSLDPFIKEHVTQLAKTTGLGDDDESLETLSRAWLEKKKIFEDRVGEEGMDEIDFFGASDARGGLVMTYSGSLLNIGPLVDGARRCEYNAIGLRKDVPESASEDSSELASDFGTDEPATFSRGPVRKTSPVLKIARFVKKMDPATEEEKLAELTLMVAEDFAEINKTVAR